MTDRLDLGSLPKDREAKLRLVTALIERPDRWKDARDLLARRYPHLPEDLRSTAVHHLYGDLPDALLDFLGLIELSLREPDREMGFGAASHVLDHLYRWFQMQAILPHGVGEVLESVRLAKQKLAEGDVEYAASVLDELQEFAEGWAPVPEFS